MKASIQDLPDVAIATLIQQPVPLDVKRWNPFFSGDKIV